MDKTHGTRFSWKNPPKHLEAILKALIRRGGWFRYPADIGAFIRGVDRFYNGEKGKADEVQRFLQNIGVVVCHVLPGGRKTYYVDADRSRAVLCFLKDPKKYERPVDLGEAQMASRAAALHRAASASEAKSHGPEVAAMDPVMERLRRRHLAATGAHAAVDVTASASPAVEAKPERDTIEVSDDDSATVADASAPRDVDEDAVADGQGDAISSVADASMPRDEEGGAVSSASSGNNTKQLPTRVLFMTRAEWWVWEYFVALRAQFDREGGTMGNDEFSRMFRAELDLSGDDTERPSHAECVSAAARMADHRLLDRYRDSPSGNGIYSFRVDPYDFHTEIIDERVDVTVKRGYLDVAQAMMAGHGPSRVVHRWQWETRYLAEWLKRGGYGLSASTVRIKMCGSEKSPFTAQNPQLYWCVWYSRMLRGELVWLLAWPGFLPVNLRAAKAAESGSKVAIDAPAATDAPVVEEGVAADAPVVAAHAEAVAEAAAMEEVCIADDMSANAPIDDAPVAAEIVDEPVAAVTDAPVAAVTDAPVAAIADAPADNGAPVPTSKSAVSPLEQLQARIDGMEADLAASQAEYERCGALTAGAQLESFVSQRDDLELQLAALQARLRDTQAALDAKRAKVAELQARCANADVHAERVRELTDQLRRLRMLRDLLEDDGVAQIAASIYAPSSST